MTKNYQVGDIVKFDDGSVATITFVDEYGNLDFEINHDKQFKSNL